MASHHCPHCFKRLKTARGVTQHIFQVPSCKIAHLRSISNSSVTEPTSAKDPVQEEDTDDLRRSTRVRKATNEGTNPRRVAPRTETTSATDREPNDEEASNVQEGDLFDYDSVTTVESNPEEEASDSGTVDGTVRERFVEYCEGHQRKFLKLTRADKSSIQMMDILKRKKAPLNAYPELMTWHLKALGHLRSHETLKDSQHYFHRTTLVDKLIPRYNMTSMMPKLKKVTLPSSKARVSIPCRQAADVITHLLTDPQVEDSDYLFFQDDPLAPPPKNVTHIADLNTGDAYLKTYQQKITKKNQVLLAVPMYIDGATTGQFSDLPVTALKLSLGIHNRKARDKERAWLELGWLPEVRKQTARGNKLFKESGHLESLDVLVVDGEGDSADEDWADDDEEEEDGAVKAQDFHTMLKTILESFVELQRTGMVWDLVYKGKLYKNIEFVIFVPFVKCDTEEADLLCGKYLTRTKNVKHCCRYCHCPMDKADDPRSKFPPKLQPSIQKLVEKKRFDKLQAISQQYIKNAWYDVGFHEATKAGIHGACPSEMLHAVLLGIFKYLRDIFFKYMGKYSQLAEDIDSIAKRYGQDLTHQSDRDFPNTNFTKGIQKGKLMGKEYRGVLLIMAAVLRSTGGREKLFKRKKFGGEDGLRDWTLLVELLLEWEAYLCEETMSKAMVKRLVKKNRFIMYIMRNVAVRTTGMGLKLFKFHAMTHLVEDILLYGVPSEVDTGSNESHHKPSKHVRTRRNSEIWHANCTRTVLFRVLYLPICVS